MALAGAAGAMPVAAAVMAVLEEAACEVHSRCSRSPKNNLRIPRPRRRRRILHPKRSGRYPSTRHQALGETAEAAMALAGAAKAVAVIVAVPALLAGTRAVPVILVVLVAAAAAALRQSREST